MVFHRGILHKFSSSGTCKVSLSVTNNFLTCRCLKDYVKGLESEADKINGSVTQCSHPNPPFL